MTLVEALDDCESALEDGDEYADEERIAALGGTTAEAEDALVDALNEPHTLIAADTDLTADVPYLAALEHLAYDEDEEPLH